MLCAAVSENRSVNGRPLPTGSQLPRGQYAYGAPPYGWQARKKELTPEEMEQAGRARARQLRDEDELSYREIAAVLEAEDIRPKRGERWHPETVRRMLVNTTDRPSTLRKRTA
jgi:Recombinase.